MLFQLSAIRGQQSAQAERSEISYQDSAKAELPEVSRQKSDYY